MILPRECGAGLERRPVGRALEKARARDGHTRLPGHERFADGLTVTNQYDGLRRRTNIAVYAGSTLLSGTGYSYDGASRLDLVSDAVHAARYEYLTNSSRAGTVTFKNNGQTVMTTTREYDSTNRLKRVATATASGASVYSALYTYDAAGRRIQATAAPDNTRWDYGYDSLGQVTSGRKYWCDGSFVAGQQFEYAFDTIGNRKWTKAGGDLSGGSLRTALYTNNLLNQITARQVPGSVDVQGIAQSGAAVTVNGQAVLRQGEYYAKTLTWNTATGAVCAWVTNIASLAGQSTTNIGNLYLSKNPETNAFDADGNLKEDARWKYTWDAENRLVKMMSRGAPTNLGTVLMFTYDWQGRRASKVVSNWTGAAWALSSNVRFVYDGWNLLAELNATNNGVIRSYAWGTDASGSMQGAGGVGGLMWVTSTATASTHYPSYDGNHNVMALVNAATGETSAQYEYGPFHELLRATGPMAKENVFLAATKYQDWETGFYYYGYRYYSPSAGRWINRDPIGERGGKNLHGMVNNDPVDKTDYIGLDRNDPPRIVVFDVCPSKCGPDVTSQVSSSMREIESRFHAADFSKKTSACEGLRDVTRFAVSGGFNWELQDMYDAGDRDNQRFDTTCGIQKNGTRACSRSVTYQGACVYASAVSYVMWGKMFSLCASMIPKPSPASMYDLDAAILLAQAFKAGRGDIRADMLGQVGEMVKQGFLGGTANLDSYALPCAASNCRVVGTFNWKWEPIQSYR